MKYITATTALILSLATVDAAVDFSGHKLLRLQDVSKKTLNVLLDFEQRLKSPEDFDFWKIAATSDIHISDKIAVTFTELLHSEGISYQILTDNLQNLVDESTIDRHHKQSKIATDAEFDYSIYHNYDEILQWIDDTVAAYPFVTKQLVGQTELGRDIYGLKIAPAEDTTTQIMFLMATIHAREWIAPGSTVKVVDMLLKNYILDDGSDASNQARAALHDQDWYVVPVTNVDGYEYTWTTNRLWRKTLTHHPGNECIGTDPNRNWPTVNWENDEGSNSDSCSILYRGPYALSEPCMIAMDNYVRNISSLKPIKASFDIHSYSQLFMYAHGDSTEPASNDAILAEIGKNVTDAIRNVHGTEFVYGSLYDTLYAVSGDTVDYLYENFDVPCSSTVELRDTGYYGFLLPERYIIPVAEEMYEAYMVMSNAVMDGYCDSK